MPILQEFWLHLRRLALLGPMAIRRWRKTRQIRRSGAPYVVALLQLDHDPSFRTHGPFPVMAAFIEATIRGFARGAPDHHHLVFKAHPLEDGRTPLGRTIRRIARAHGISDRVHVLPGGKLAYLLQEACSAVTVTSTAGQQVLQRGLPLKALGQAVYAKPELVSTQSLQDFFADPTAPDPEAYATFRTFLLQTSQVPGGFYSASGRQSALRRCVALILQQTDPYQAVLSDQPSEARLRVVQGGRR